jgi:rsbT co-antagonist protein RsbR
LAAVTVAELGDVESPSLTSSERAALGEFWSVYERHFDRVAAEIEQDAHEHPELGSFVGAVDPASRGRTRSLIRTAIEEGDWLPYLVSMQTAGVGHAEAGLGFSAWFDAGRALRRRVMPIVVEMFESEPRRLAEAVRGLAIFVDLALVAVAGAYLATKEQIIRTQQAEILELSTPVLELSSGLLLMPVIGALDTTRARNLTGQLLEEISAKRSRVVILDVTGVPVVDSAVANHLVQTVEAARLMGATGILSGLSAANAQALSGLGIGLPSVITVGTLADAVQGATQLLHHGAARPDGPLVLNGYASV